MNKLEHKGALSMEQSQKLVLTQQMRESIEILQMTCMELKQHIDQALLSNPLLEQDDATTENIEQNEAQTEERAESANQIEWEDYFQDGYEPSYAKGGGLADSDESGFDFERIRYGGMDLHAHLKFQLKTSGTSADAKRNKICLHLIDCIDGDGYLFVDKEEAAQILGVTIHQVEDAIQTIQTFDPPGVGARNIGECLAIQLRELGLLTPTRQMLLGGYLLDIANNHFKKVAVATGLDEATIAAFKMQLKELNPRPGCLFDPQEALEYVVPDGSIEWVDGKLLVHINDISAPRLTINRVYRRLLTNRDSCDAGTREYIKSNLDKALALVKNIDKRRETIRRIITVIGEVQEDYFLSRCEHLLPLTLAEVAEQADVHESTVSRAVRGKYIQTPKGIFALKDFFKRGYTTGNTAVSSDGICTMLRELIDGENPMKPLSDQKLTDALAERGIVIARRTVAKYREGMGIPTASGRKQH